MLLKGAGGLEVRLQGLAGVTRMADVLTLSAAALGLPDGAEVALRSDARVLRGEETLEEAGMLCEGGELEMWMGRPGGMHTYVAIEEEVEEEADAVIDLGFLAMAAGTKWLRNIGPV